MFDWLKRHWLMLAAVALFLAAVYYAVSWGSWAKGAAFTAGAAAVLVALATPWGLWALLVWAFAAYAFNWIWGFIPGADGWYDKLPRKDQTSDFAARTSLN